MAEEFIEELYEKADVIFEAKKLIRHCRCGQAHLFILGWERLKESIVSLCSTVTEINANLGVEIWDEFVECGNDASISNYESVGDQLEELIPQLYTAMELFGKIDVTEGKYRIYSTKSGYLGLENVVSGYRLNGKLDPAWEGYEKAREIYQPRIKKFATLGCDLGYLCWQMYAFSDESIDVWIYDIDETVVQYAIHYGVLSRIPDEHIHFVIQNDAEKLVKAFETEYLGYDRGETALYIELEILDKLGSQRKTAENVFTTLCTSRNLLSMTERNFIRNTENVPNCITDISGRVNTKEWVVVGGGPSVDICIEYLRNVTNKTIIASTTIYERLIDENIRPDYIIAIDPQNRTYEHLRNITDSSVPLLISDVANWQFGEKYKGEKYIIPTATFYFTDNYWNKKGIDIWNTAETVTGMCIEVAINMGASTIELIGVDLAYPNGYTHATGTMDNKEIIHEEVKVEAVDGGLVCTNLQFVDYINEIEEQIRRHPEVSFYNLSQHGAKIAGAIKKDA